MDVIKLRLYQLHKQNLIQKEDLNRYGRILKEHIGLHSTDFLTPYLSLWARVEDFEPRLLFDDLNEPWTALKVRAFRGTIFVIHKENLSVFYNAAKIFLSSIVKAHEKFLSKEGVDYHAVEREVVTVLSNKNQLTMNELKKRLSNNLINKSFNYALRYLEFKGVVFRTHHRYIMDKVIRYGLLEEWFPKVVSDEIEAEDALKILVLKYITQFGPVSFDDLSWWFPLNKSLARKMLERLSEHLVSIDFNNDRYFMEQDDYHKFKDFVLPDSQWPVIHFIPYEDHFPKAYSIRNWFLSDEVAPLVQKKGTIYLGQLFPSIWLNGEIIGGWEMNWVDKDKATMKVEITGIHQKAHLDATIIQIIERKRIELENFVNEKLVPLIKQRSNGVLD